MADFVVDSNDDLFTKQNPETHLKVSNQGAVSPLQLTQENSFKDLLYVSYTVYSNTHLKTL